MFSHTGNSRRIINVHVSVKNLGATNRDLRQTSCSFFSNHSNGIFRCKHYSHKIPTELSKILKCPLKIHRYVQLIMTCARQVMIMDVSSYAQSSLLLSMLFGVLLNSGNSIVLEYSHACAGLTMTLGVIILCIHIERKCFSHACVTA